VKNYRIVLNFWWCS